MTKMTKKQRLMCDAYDAIIKRESAESRVRELEAERDRLRDFAIWLTGCGYDFQQNEYFRKNQHLLSKAMTAAKGGSDG